MRGSHENCLEAVSEGLKLSRETGVHVMDIIVVRKCSIMCPGG